MTPRVFAGVAELAAAVGEELGHSQWHRVGQREISAFADATGDHQWIHTDRERAAASPFASTVAHGYYLLSIMPALLAEVFRIDGVGMVVNTGVDELRFHKPVPAGASVRLRAQLAHCQPRRRGVAEMTVAVEMLLPNRAEPCCTALVHSVVRPTSNRAQPVGRTGSR